MHQNDSELGYCPGQSELRALFDFESAIFWN
jgi:hypothetical protein